MSRRTIVIVAGLLVAVTGGVAWFGFDHLRDRRAASGTTAVQRHMVGADQGPREAARTEPATGLEATAQRQAAAAGAAAPSDSAAAGMDTTLALAGGPVLLSFPDGFALATTQEQLAVPAQIPACDQGFDYCVYLDSGEYEDTNFSSAGVRIDVRTDLGSEADCVLAQPSGYTDLVPVVAGASDFATTMFPDVDQGAAGHFSHGSVGRLYFDSVCYEFETRVAQAQFGNYPSGTVQEFDAADVRAVEDRLTGVLDRVTLPDGRSALWARKVRSQPDATRP